MTRRDDRAYREYVREEQHSQRGCIAGRMQLEFHHGVLAHEMRLPKCNHEDAKTRRTREEDDIAPEA